MTHSCVTWLIHMWDNPVTCEWVMSPVSGTRQWVMSHMNKSRHIWTSHVTYEWVMSHMNERVITLTCDMTHSMCVHTSQVLTPNATDLYSKSKRGLLHECPTHVHCWVLWLGSLLYFFFLRKKTCTQIGFFSRPFAKSTRLLFEVKKAIIINLPRQRYFSKCMGLSHIKSSPIWNVVPYEKSKALSHLIIDLPRQRGDGSWKAEKVGK